MRKLIPLLCILCCNSVFAAVCTPSPVAEQIHDAQIVFVATIADASTEASLSSLSNGDRYRVDYRYSIRQSLKGDPELVPSLFTINIYHAYDSTLDISGQETRLLPGDNVLVIASEPGPTQVAVCSPSRPWRPEMLDHLGHRWPSNNSFKPTPLRGSA